MMNKEQALKQIEQALEILRQEEPENTYRKPEYGDRYYYVGEGGSIETKKWCNDCWNRDRYNFGNVFLTRKEAEKEARARSLMNNLYNMARYGKDEGTKYEIFYLDNMIKVRPLNPNGAYLFPVFNSEEAVQQAIDKYRDELIWYFTEYMEGL